VTPVYELTGVSKVYRAGVRTVEADAGRYGWTAATSPG
jgi:hypothetical protein